MDGTETESEHLECIVNAEAERTYLRGRFLGQGAHATVYLVTDLTDASKKEYAMKVVHLEPSSEGEKAPSEPQKPGFAKVRQRGAKLSQVRKEVDIHGLMRHKNVVRLEAHFQSDSKFYMVMEHCEMNNLAQLLRACKRLGEGETRNFLRQLLAGLQHIHDRGIIHRDLKPANIYLTQDLVLKIGDFGLADSIHSNKKGICGTPNYISPEVLNELGYTTAVDIWAAGCITYHMITGRPPFEAPNQSATYDLIRGHRYPAIPPRQAGAALRHLINWMLAFRPEDRPSIPLIFSHAWMKKDRGRIAGPFRKERRTLLNFRKALPQTAPLADLRSESAKDVRDESSQISPDEKGSPLWWIVSEKTKSTALCYEQARGTSLLCCGWRRTRFSLSHKKKAMVVTAIEKALRGLPVRCDASSSSSSEVIDFQDDSIPIFVSKWIDYSNKYGFGYELSNGVCGVVFNDSSRMTFDHGRGSPCGRISRGKESNGIVCTVRSAPAHLQGKIALLSCFVDYMDANLSSCPAASSNSTASADLRQWMRNDKIIIFKMTDGLLQINFFKDHYKLILYEDRSRVETEMVLLTISEGNRIGRHYLNEMAKSGCPEKIIPHLMYVHWLLTSIRADDRGTT